jgi:arylesterase / paraoxonase
MADPSQNGAFWIYDYGNEDSLQPVELVGFPAGRTFHPLGLDVLPATVSEPVYVFTANLDAKASVVDIFTVSDKVPYKAFYKRTLSHPFIHAPNSIVAISPTQLYISVDHRFTPRMPKWTAKLALLENAFQAPFGWIAYVEILPNGGVKYRKAANFINFANGKNI